MGSSCSLGEARRRRDIHPSTVCWRGQYEYEPHCRHSGRRIQSWRRAPTRLGRARWRPPPTDAALAASPHRIALGRSSRLEMPPAGNGIFFSVVLLLPYCGIPYSFDMLYLHCHCICFRDSCVRSYIPSYSLTVQLYVIQVCYILNLIYILYIMYFAMYFHVSILH